MNALLFKDSDGSQSKKSSSELDAVALQKGLFPHFAEELLNQINCCLNENKELLLNSERSHSQLE